MQYISLFNLVFFKKYGTDFSIKKVLYRMVFYKAQYIKKNCI